MKKIFAFLLFTTLLTGCGAPTPIPTSEPSSNPAAGNTRPDITDPATPIEVQAGEMFHLVVDSNPSTGYHWDLVSELDGNIVEFVSSDYTADEPVMPGSGGVDVWAFKAVAAGQTQITLGSFPPDTSVTEPEETVTFDIIVK
jgi:inhibitor of cysteine peptidase